MADLLVSFVSFSEQHSAPRGSAKRQEVFARKGHFQVPYLEDANTGAELFESSAIIDYLKAVYAK